MKQIQFIYKDEESFDEDLRKISQWRDSRVYSTILFHIFTGKSDEKMIGFLCSKIRSLPYFRGRFLRAVLHSAA